MGLTGGSLCSGSGGLDLGLGRALGVRWAWHAEPDRDAARVLAARWPGVPNHGDLFAVDWGTVEPVGLVAAGFPCPDYSVAGRRAGIEGEHGSVWHGVADALRALRPALVILENVDGIRTAPGLDRDAGESALGVVLADLAALGYDACWSGLRAADVGAPHGRLRWFLVGALAPDAEGAGVRSDRRVRRGDAGAPRPGGSAPSALASRPEVVRAEDALADGGRAPADPDDAGRGEYERAEPAGAEHAAAERGRPVPASDAAGAGRARPAGERLPREGGRPSGGGREDAGERELPATADSERERLDRGGGGDAGAPAGRGADRRAEPPRSAEAAADADGRGLEGVREPEPGGVEGASGGEPDRRDPDRGLGDAKAAAADAEAVGREGRGQGASGEPDREPPRGRRSLSGDGADRGAAPAPDTAGGGRDHGVALLGVVEPAGGADAAPDPGREPAEPRGRGRASRGDPARGGAEERDGDGLARPAEPGQAVAAPADADGVGRREGEPEPEVRDGWPGALVGAERVEWGVYEDAVRRWERASGRAAPRPTDDRGRLDPRFVEWMLGYPPGWVDLPDVSRTAQLRLLGNSVQVQCAERVGAWLVFLLHAGLLPDPWAEPVAA